MLEIRALREVERWSPPNLVIATLIAVAVVSALVWAIYRYLRD